MGLVNENERKSLFRRETDSPQAKATSLIMMEQGGSISASFRDRSPNNTLLHSFKIVILSNKLNLLLPFGPLAILLHYLTYNNNKVSRLLFQLLELEVSLLVVMLWLRDGSSCWAY